MVEKDKIIPITVEMFRPDGYRSVWTDKQLSVLMEQLTGRGRLNFYLGLKAGNCLSEEEARKTDGEINEHVLKAIGRYHKWPAGTVLGEPYIQQFFIQQQKQANGVIGYLGGLLPELAQHVELKDELSSPSDEPSYLFGLLSDPPASIDSTLAYEAHRLALLSILAGRINAANLNGRSHTVLSGFQKLFNQHLFEGVKGKGKKIWSESFHNNSTNEVVGFPDGNNQNPPSGTHLKRGRFTVRSIKDVGLVYTKPRRKGDTVSIIKSIAEALDNKKGKIDTDAVKDKIGRMFVLMEDRVTPTDFADLVVGVMKLGPKPIVRVEPSDTVEQNRGQSPRFKFDARRIIYFKDDPIPFELGILTRKNYLNSTLEIGHKDPQTGFYTGMAHDLFDLKRARRVAPVLFPEEIYEIDLDDVFVRQSQRKARDLREMYIVEDVAIF